MEALWPATRESEEMIPAYWGASVIWDVCKSTLHMPILMGTSLQSRQTKYPIV